LLTRRARSSASVNGMPGPGASTVEGETMADAAEATSSAIAVQIMTA
jgi:hypothetical protein